MDRPYSRFFWRDYEHDLNLSACHPFAQGVWMRMLCVMQQGEPYGHLRIEPRTAMLHAPETPPAGARGAARGGATGTPRGGAGGIPRGTPPGTPSGLAPGGAGGSLQTRYTLPPNGSLERLIFSRCGVTQEQMEWAIHHLEEHHVFSRTDDGVIFCRRMVREDQEHKQRVARARKAYEKRERKKGHKNQPEQAPEPGEKRGNAVDRAVTNGTASGGAGGTPHGGAGGVPRGIPGGPPTTTTRVNTKPTPPTPPAAAGGATEQPHKPSRNAQQVAEALEIAKRQRAGGGR